MKVQMGLRHICAACLVNNPLMDKSNRFALCYIAVQSEGVFMLRYQNLLIGHGLLVLLVALIAGFMLGFGLVGGVETAPGSGAFVQLPFYYGSAEGWARAHTGGITNGLMMLALALVLPHLFGDPIPLRRFFPYSFIFIGWANTAFYWLGNAAGNRALSFGDNRFGAADAAGMIAMGLASAAALLSLVLLAWGAWRVLWVRD